MVWGHVCVYSDRVCLRPGTSFVRLADRRWEKTTIVSFRQGLTWLVARPRLCTEVDIVPCAGHCCAAIRFPCHILELLLSASSLDGELTYIIHVSHAPG